MHPESSASDTRTCPICATTFQPDQPYRFFCSDACLAQVGLPLMERDGIATYADVATLAGGSAVTARFALKGNPNVPPTTAVLGLAAPENPRHDPIAATPTSHPPRQKGGGPRSPRS